MTELKDLFQSGEWKAEKHVPVIEVPGKIKKGEVCKFTVTVGRAVPHPNTTEHHIRWMEVYFQPSGERFPIEVGKFEFTAHGEAGQGPNASTVYTHPEVVVSFKTEKPGTLLAASYCNIHGLWQSSLAIGVE